MTHSDQINELAAALTAAQAKIEGAKKDSRNPHFNSAYADLASVWDACRGALAANKLAVMQTPRTTPPLADGLPYTVEVETMLMHASGQWMRDTLAVPITKIDAQGVGSAITYARRYALAAFVGIAPEDDDGNKASEKPQGYAAKDKAPIVAPKGYSAWLDGFQRTADSGKEALNEAWRKTPAEFRAYLTSQDRDLYETIKGRAASAEVGA